MQQCLQELYIENDHEGSQDDSVGKGDCLMAKPDNLHLTPEFHVMEWKE